MKVYAPFLDDPVHQRHMLENSIERVLNNGVSIVEKSDQLDSEEAQIFLDDVDHLKSTLRQLWGAAQDSVRINRMVQDNDPIGHMLKKAAEKAAESNN